MKTLLTFFFILLTYWSTGQSYETVYELVEVEKEQTIYLNQLLRFKGKNKNYLQFQLPPNTVSWYYSFGTHVNKEAPKQRGTSLKDQLIDLWDKKGELLVAVADAVSKPTGVAAIHVYLTNTSYATAFVSEDFWESTAPLDYHKAASRQNLTAGVIGSNMTSQEPLCLAFYNPSARQGVSITVQIYAQVAKKVYVDEWATASMNQLNSNCLSFFTHNNEAIQNVCGCVTEQIMRDYTPKEFIEASKERQGLAFNQSKQVCYSTTNTAHIEEQDIQIKQLIKDITGLRAIKNYAAMVSKYDTLIALGKKDDKTYNGLAWNCLLSRQFDKAKNALVAGLGEEPNSLKLQGNLAHYYLLTGDFEAAKAIHLRFKGQQITEETEWKEMVRQDLLTFENLDIYHPDFNKARRLVGLPNGRLAQVFDTRYAVGGTVAFQRGSRSYVGTITALDKDKGENTLAYHNIYGESQSARISVLQVTPLTAALYQQKLQAWQAEIAKYKYTLGEIATWQKQNNTRFGRITQLNDNSHKATIEHQDSYGETVQSTIPYLDIIIISTTTHDSLNHQWQQQIRAHQFMVGEQVRWSTSNLLTGLETVEQGEVIQLNDQSHLAHIRYVNKKGKEKVVKKGYLLLEKVRA